MLGTCTYVYTVLVNVTTMHARHMYMLYQNQYCGQCINRMGGGGIHQGKHLLYPTPLVGFCGRMKCGITGSPYFLQ